MITTIDSNDNVHIDEACRPADLAQRKADSLQSVQHFYRPGDVAYLMIKNVADPNFPRSNCLCGYFDHDHLPQMVERAYEYSGRCESVFIAINKLKSEALNKRRNQLGPAYSSVAIEDQDIERRTRLMIDIDPKRSTTGHCCATTQERNASRLVADRICEFLTNEGLPIHMFCCSGNGFHIHLIVSLPAVSDVPKRVLRSIKVAFETESVEVDLAVSKASQLTRLYGTRVCKGANTADRPHSDSYVIESNPNADTIAPNSLERLISIGESSAGSVVPTPNTNLDTASKLRRARAYVSQMPPAISGQGGHDQTFEVACRLILGFEIPIDEALPLMREYNQQCQPPWQEHELIHKLEEANGVDESRGRGYLLGRASPRPVTDGNQVSQVTRTVEFAVSDLPCNLRDFVPMPINTVLNWLTDNQAEPPRGRPAFNHDFHAIMQTFHAVFEQHRSPVLIPDLLFKAGVGGANAPKRWASNVSVGGKKRPTGERAKSSLERCSQSIADISNELQTLVVTDPDCERPESEQIEKKTYQLIEEQKFFQKNVVERCEPYCPLHGSTVSHKHYKFAPKEAFFGCLFRFSKPADEGHLVFDFDSVNDSGCKLVVELIKEGELCWAYMPVQIFGQACGLSLRQIRMIQGLVRERTRPSKSKTVNNCLNTKGLVEAGRVPGKRGQGSVVCPYLDPSESYTVFGGNMKKCNMHGRGYQIIGRLETDSNGGWLRRFGYPAESNQTERNWELASFMLSDLAKLSSKFDLVVCAFGQDQQWRSLEQLQQMNRLNGNRAWLGTCTMRIFAPSDFLIRWRQWFASQLGYSFIPGGDWAQPNEPTGGTQITPEAAKIILRSANIAQKELAVRLGMSVSAVSRQLSGKNKFSKELQQEIQVIATATVSNN